MNLAVSLNNLSELHHALGAYAKAEEVLKQSLAIYEREAGPEAVEVADSLVNLAELYITQGRHGDAQPLMERALAIHSPSYRSVSSILKQGLDRQPLVEEDPEQGELPLLIGEGLIGHRGDTAVQAALGEVPTGGEMKVAKQDLSGAEQGDFGGLGFLDLDHQVAVPRLFGRDIPSTCL